MMESIWWIREIDWRISSGIIFFIQLVVWGGKEKKKTFGLRIFLSLGMLCGASFCMRWLMETYLTAKAAAAVGYSIYIMILSTLFMVCYYFCYREDTDVIIYNGIVALVVYRLSWNAVKLISNIPIRGDASWTNGSPFQSLMSYLLYFVMAIGCCQLYHHYVGKRASFLLNTIAKLYIIVLLNQMFLEFIYQFMDKARGKQEALFFMVALLYCSLIYALLMTISRLMLLKQENISLQHFIQSNQRYYEISKEGILSLQIKCHDLKHQIGMLRTAEGQHQLDRYIQGLSQTLDEYNTVVDCGNKCLDVVLTEKNIICSMSGIRFDYIIDGSLFSFMEDMDIYALFGNVLDNAIEGMEKVKHREERFISLKAARRNRMVILVVENYFEHKLKFLNGRPVTTKREVSSHGFGMRSICAIAQKYGGGVSICAEKNIFKITITMKIAGKQEEDTTKNRYFTE